MEDKKTKNFKDGNQKKKHGFWFWFSNALIWSVIAGLFIFGGLEFADKYSGYKVLPNHTAVIVSDSMSNVNPENLTYLDPGVNHIEKGDIISAKEYKSYDDVKLLDVVIYKGDSGELICHRVVDKYEDSDGKWVVTKGDANTSTDTPVSFDIVRGKVTKTMKGAGKIIMFMQSLYFVFALCGSCFFILLGILIANIKVDKKKEKVVEPAKKVEEPKPQKTPEIPAKKHEIPANFQKKPTAPKAVKNEEKVTRGANGKFVSKKKQ